MAMICDAGKIRNLRERLGYTQEILALKAGVDRRTIQRAEGSRSLQLESAAQIAAALQVTVQDIKDVNRVGEAAVADDSIPSNAVVLRRTVSGKEVLDAIVGSFAARFECDVEPDLETAQHLIDLIRAVENLLPDPWNKEVRVMRLSDHVETGLVLSTKMCRLAASGIGMYVGRYTASALVPRYDEFEGCMYTKTTQRPEPVTICLLRIAAENGDRHMVGVSDIWTRDRATVLPELNDDIPF